MRSRSLMAMVLSALALSIGGPAAAQTTSDTFCVRVSRVVQPGNLNTLVRQKRVTIKVVPDSECAPQANVTSPTQSVTSFVTYTTHAAGVASDYGDYFDQVAAAADTLDLDAMASALRSLRDHADREVAWLDSHPPASCYQRLHTEWRSINVAYASAAQTTLRGVENLDVDLMSEGADQMAGAAERVSVLGDETPTYVAACSE